MSDSIFTEATTWFFRLAADDTTLAECEAFDHWLTGDPQHAEAWQAVQQLYAALESPAKAIRQQGLPVSAKKTKWQHFSFARAASVLMVCVVLVVYWQPDVLQNLQSDYHTATGEQRQIVLADGSKILLNTDSAVTVDIENTVRKVQLLRGEAFFEVAHAPERPFWVKAGVARARVTGTAFSVGRDEGAVTIAVVHGRVETSTEGNPGRITPLTANESARYQDQLLANVQHIDVQKSLAWRQGQLVFVQATLAEVVAQINRYRPGRLLITDGQLKNRPITAVFSVKHLDEAINALEQTLGVRARRLADYWVLLG
ncbi:FecR family protein [Methylovulum miyakonense]|uniref:FecR family protein n=1 Tax=Methylovulum miyakonense TaxID=645578 RepID=UPI00037B9F9F|nr:FecR family protein [Methylovulum miyakonense]